MLRNLSTGTEASATGESLNSGDVAVHPAARHTTKGNIYVPGTYTKFSFSFPFDEIYRHVCFFSLSGVLFPRE